MAYDEHLAERVRDAVPAGAVEKPMFGGLGFMVDGHLTVALGLGGLMVRVGAEAVSSALGQPGASPCVMGERTMKDWVIVEVSMLSDDQLAGWVERATSFVSTLPAR